MAEQNIKMNVKTDTGYDTLYPQTKANLVTFNSSSITAKEVNGAINEIFDKSLKKTDVINNLVSTSTTQPLSANMGKNLGEKIDGIGAEITSGGYPYSWNITEEYKDIGNSARYVRETPYFKVESSGTSKIIIKSEGNYLLHANIGVQTYGGTANVYLSIVKNGQSVQRVIQLCSEVSAVNFVTTSYLYPGETVECRVSKQGVGTTTALPDDSYLSVTKLS